MRAGHPGYARRVFAPRVRPVPPLILVLVWTGALPGSTRAQIAAPLELRLGTRPGNASAYVHEKRLTLYLPDEMGGTTTTRTTLRLEQRLEDAVLLGVHVGAQGEAQRGRGILRSYLRLNLKIFFYIVDTYVKIK